MQRGCSAYLRLAAVASTLLALVVLPTLHGSLSHAHDACSAAESESSACLDAGHSTDLAQRPFEDCPLCLAAGQARPLPSPLLPGLPQREPDLRATPCPASAQRPGIPLLALSAPRAPPVSS